MGSRGKVAAAMGDAMKGDAVNVPAVMGEAVGSKACAVVEVLCGAWKGNPPPDAFSAPRLVGRRRAAAGLRILGGGPFPPFPPLLRGDSFSFAPLHTSSRIALSAC